MVACAVNVTVRKAAAAGSADVGTAGLIGAGGGGARFCWCVCSAALFDRRQLIVVRVRRRRIRFVSRLSGFRRVVVK